MQAISLTRLLALQLLLTLCAANALADRPSPFPNYRLFPVHRRSLLRSYRPAGVGKVPVAFFDADSTLRVSKSGSPSANHPKDVILLPRVAPRLKRLVRDGYLIAIVSNQGGVEKGFVTYATADAGLRQVCRLLSRLKVPIHWYDFAPAYNHNRKPRTGMADALARALKGRYGRKIDWKRSFMVGDSAWKRKKDREPDGRPGEDFSNSDRRFAEAVRKKYRCPRGFAFHHPRDFFGWARYGTRNFHKLHQVRAYVAAHPKQNPGVNPEVVAGVGR